MTQKLKIAVADDERDTREYLQEYLAYLGHDVRAAADGRELVELCRAFGPDLIVTDYAMPGLDGLTAAAKVNQDRLVPVILVSGRHDVETLAHTDGSHVVKFLAKPVKEAELKATIEAVTAKRSPGRADDVVR